MEKATCSVTTGAVATAAVAAAAVVVEGETEAVATQLEEGEITESLFFVRFFFFLNKDARKL